MGDLYAESTWLSELSGCEIEAKQELYALVVL